MIRIVGARFTKRIFLTFWMLMVIITFIKGQLIEDYNLKRIYKEYRFSNMNEIDSFFTTQGNHSLIDGHVFLKGPGILNLKMFSDVRIITGLLSIEDTGISNLEGLNNLEGCMGISLDGNKNLQVVNNLTSISQLYSFDCNRHPILKSIHLSSVPSSVNWLVIADNSELESVCCFDSLKIVESLLIQFNPRLKVLPAFTRLDTVIMRLAIMGNDLLRDLTGLENIKRIGGSLLINFNKSISSIESLRSIEHIGTLEVSFNDSLSQISKMGNLHTISKALEIGSNPLLENIDALLGVVASNCKITVTGNPMLRDCPFKSITRWRREDVLIAANGGKECSDVYIKFKK